jgi:hypothetical protein
VTRLERRCRWLLFAYPAWYRRRRAREMLGTMLETSPPGGRWPSFRDTRSLVAGGLRVRGWVWLLSMLWVAAGAVGTGYDFYITTKPYTWADVSLGIEGWSTDQDRHSSGNCRIVGSAYPTADCRVRQVSWLAAGQLAAYSCVGGGVDCRLRAHIPGRCLGRIPRELTCDWQPCRAELGGAGDLCRVAGAWGGADPDPGR